MIRRLTGLIPLLMLALAGTACGAESSMAEAQKSVANGYMKTEHAILAGGCFWCMEHPFEELDGVISVTSGYTGGHVENPSYEQVSSGSTGHAEAVEVLFDPAKIGYAQILDVFWHQIDPTDAGGQFVDRGSQYRSGIYPLNAEQRRVAEASKRQMAATGPFKKPLVTEIVMAGPFYPAEEYHQDYYKTHSWRYRFYRSGSGRDQFLNRVWGKTE